MGQDKTTSYEKYINAAVWMSKGQNTALRDFLASKKYRRAKHLNSKHKEIKTIYIYTHT